MLGFWVSGLKHKRCWKGKSNDRKAWILFTREFCDCPVLRIMFLSAGVTFLVSRLTPTDEFSSSVPNPAPRSCSLHEAIGEYRFISILEASWTQAGTFSWGLSPALWSMEQTEESIAQLCQEPRRVAAPPVTAHICPMAKNKAILSWKWLSPPVNQPFYRHLRSPTKTSWALWEPPLSFLSFSLVTDTLGSWQGI